MNVASRTPDSSPGEEGQAEIVVPPTEAADSPIAFVAGYDPPEGTVGEWATSSERTGRPWFTNGSRLKPHARTLQLGIHFESRTLPRSLNSIAHSKFTERLEKLTGRQWPSSCWVDKIPFGIFISRTKRARIQC